MKQLILASASPRRHELLNLIGIDHIVKPCSEKEPKIVNNSKGEETENDTKTIEEQVLSVAYNKAMCVVRSLSENERSHSVILGADTIVILEGEIIGKPKNKQHALELLQKLLGKTHLVFTGLCLYDCSIDKCSTSIEKTAVTMSSWTIERLEKYIEKEHILDKAGAYAIQGIGAAMIEKIDGCFYNVMGLPINRLVTMLDGIGYDFLK